MFMKKIKKLLTLALTVFFSTSIFAPGMAVSYQQEGDVRLFYDKVVPHRYQADGSVVEWRRITHCKKAGTNCIIGPTITQ